jgi:drug/metabolite transporter (DMT)-like permease
MAHPPIAFYASDLLMAGFSLAAAYLARHEMGERVVTHWRLLLTGVLAFLGTTCLVGYPDPLDLLAPERWTTGLLAFLIGAVRGAMIGMTSDHVFRLVRLTNAADGLFAASLQTMLAAGLAIAELATGQPGQFEPIVELVLILSAGYLLGRSVVAWFRARTIAHVDIGEA